MAAITARPPSRLQTLAYGTGSLAAGLYYSFNNFVLGPYLRLYTQNNILIGWLTSTRSFEQSIVQPAVGAWSDRTWTRFGRRAPFFLIGMSLAALLLLINGLMPVHPGLLVPVVILIFLFSLAFNFGIDPYVALLADTVPSEHRGRVNGIAQVLGAVGSLAILIAAFALFETHRAWLFIGVGAALVIGFTIVALFVREPREIVAAGRISRHTLLEMFVKSPGRTFRIFLSYLGDLWEQEREAVKLLFVRFTYQFGLNAAIPFIVFFVQDEIGTNGLPELAAAFPALGLLGVDRWSAEQVAFLIGGDFILMTGFWTVACGHLADRIGKKPVFAFGLVVLGVSGLFAAFATSIPQLLFYLVFLGFGNAAQTVLFFPYLSDLIPAWRAGEFQGLSAMSETGGYFFSILLAGELLNLNLFDLGYRLVFIITGTFVLLAAIAALFVKSKVRVRTAEATASAR
ncbi:MAG: MFS transporter [Rudaea sp.]